MLTPLKYVPESAGIFFLHLKHQGHWTKSLRVLCSKYILAKSIQPQNVKNNVFEIIVDMTNVIENNAASVCMTTATWVCQQLMTCSKGDLLIHDQSDLIVTSAYYSSTFSACLIANMLWRRKDLWRRTMICNAFYRDYYALYADWLYTLLLPLARPTPTQYPWSTLKDALK